MKISESDHYFRAFVKEQGKQIENVLPKDLLALGLEFYQSYRADDALPIGDEFGDALLFQWGTREALEGYYEACFYIDITRQFISKEGKDDDAMFQLRWQIQYPPSKALQKVGTSNRWCRRLEDLATFSEFVFSHESLKAVENRNPEMVVFDLSPI